MNQPDSNPASVSLCKETNTDLLQHNVGLMFRPNDEKILERTLDCKHAVYMLLLRLQ